MNFLEVVCAHGVFFLKLVSQGVLEAKENLEKEVGSKLLERNF